MPSKYIPEEFPAKSADERIAMFNYELSLIKSDSIREFVVQCLLKAPNWFFYVASSSTGQHHNSATAGEGGLVKHSKMLCRVAQELIRLDTFEKSVDFDCAIASCILHDCCKRGLNDIADKYQFDHPMLAARFVKSMANNVNNLSEHEIRLIASAISTHMGQWNWNFDKVNPKYLPKPSTRQEYFVHLCDYFASRKSIIVNLEE